MYIFSKNIARFINEIRSAIKTVLSTEVRRKVHGDRFYDEWQQTSYPIKVVIYNNRSLLGYFDPDFYELGFHASLMHTSKQQLGQVIRHELAHYLTWLKYGWAIQPHGPEFRAFCTKMGWGEEVSSASVCLEEAPKASEVEESDIFRKVKKLMALATSSNMHEAELAMIKSQQLLLKHNLESRYLGGEDDEQVILKRILKQKRENAKMRAIAHILESFFVSTVYNRAGDFIYLEILGNAANVEIAEYVANFLQVEMDAIWNQAQHDVYIRGAVAKNSFFLGLARGYCDKIHALKKEHKSDVTQALMVIEKQLIDAKAMAYRHLVSTKSSGGHDPAASKLGELMGRKLNINPAINRSPNSSRALLENR